MKISHIISSIDISTGGPARSVTHITQAMLQQVDTLQIDLNTYNSENPLVDNFTFNRGRINFHSYEFLKFSKSLKQELGNTDTDIFHGHGLWQLPVHQMAKMARKRNIPYIITARGMLEPWALQQGALKKKLALKFFQYNDLDKATCLHATAPMEVESIRDLGLKNPIAMIPNGIALEDYPSKIHKEKKIKTILFLSRIHPKKGIELLINAWEQLDENIKKTWKIKIAGNGDQNYINQLSSIISEKGLINDIKIIGPKFGADKITCYHGADLFVLPTYSENFGIVIAEALACGVPVITTKGTPWEALHTHQAGWWIDIGVAPLIKALEQAMSKRAGELEKMGQKGRLLVESKYSIEAVARQMISLYTWILSKGEKPDFIDLYNKK